MSGLTQRFRWLREELPFVIVFALVLASGVYLFIWPDHWRRGVGLLALGTFAAAAMRLVLPASRAGALVVRGRWWDVTCYLVMGVVILAVEIRLH